MIEEVFRANLVFLETVGVDTQKGLLYSNNDAELYQQLLLMYIEDYEKKLENLEQAMKEFPTDHGKSLVRQAHGRKGENFGIGARQLGEIFYGMEKAGKEEKFETVEQLWQHAQPLWKQIVEKIREAIV